MLWSFHFRKIGLLPIFKKNHRHFVRGLFNNTSLRKKKKIKRESYVILTRDLMTVACLQPMPSEKIFFSSPFFSLYHIFFISSIDRSIATCPKIWQMIKKSNLSKQSDQNLEANYCRRIGSTCQSGKNPFECFFCVSLEGGAVGK